RLPQERGGVGVSTATSAAGLVVADVARRYRVSPSKVRAWIAAGELTAVNTAAPLARPRWVIPADALAAFERRRAGGAPRTPIRRPRRRQAVDYYQGEWGGEVGGRCPRAGEPATQRTAAGE